MTTIPLHALERAAQYDLHLRRGVPPELAFRDLSEPVEHSAPGAAASLWAWAGGIVAIVGEPHEDARLAGVFGLRVAAQLGRPGRWLPTEDLSPIKARSLAAMASVTPLVLDGLEVDHATAITLVRDYAAAGGQALITCRELPATLAGQVRTVAANTGEDTE